MSDQYGWKFILDDVTDITNLVTNFTIECAIDSYCRELSFELADDEFYDSLDFSRIPSATRIEVFTRILSTDEEDEYTDVWISQGRFFIERPTFRVGIHETTTGIWGRQSTAVLGEPFAQKITKLWDTNTTVHAIFQEIIESVGLTWDPAKCDIQDFQVYSDNFEADNNYPIEALQNLVELIVGAEGSITSDRLGNVWIRRLDRNPETSDHDVTDLVVQSINEEPEWPEFGNRIKVIPAETLSQDSITLYMVNQCIGTGAAAYLDVYAQTKDGNGVPINDFVVSWSFDPVSPLYVWFKYPATGKTAYQNSGTLLVSNEVVRATGFNSLTLAFEPSSIIGIWAYGDKNRAANFIDGGYVLDGNNVYLVGSSFSYCDQQVYVSYYADGMVKNTILYDDTISDPGSVVTYGSTTVVASISGREDTKELYIDNSCKCKSSLSVKVDPTTIAVGQNAKIEAYLENSGVPVTGTIKMVETGGFGTLQWTSRATSTTATSENTDAINVVSGVSQCVVSSAITSVTGVWVVVRDPVTNEDVKTGSNLYDSFFGRTIDLTTYVATGTSLVVEYTRAGSVTNYLTGSVAGVSRIDVSSDVATEEGLIQTVQVTVQPVVVAPPPVSGGGTSNPPPAAVSYYAQGPSVLKWQAPIDTTFGPWYIKASDGSYVQTSAMSVVGGGYVQVVNTNYLKVGPRSFGQTVTITVFGNVAGRGQVSGSMQVTLIY